MKKINKMVYAKIAATQVRTREWRAALEKKLADTSGANQWTDSALLVVIGIVLAGAILSLLLVIINEDIRNALKDSIQKFLKMT